MKEATSKVMHVGQVFGRLTILGFFKDEPRQNIYARCQCACGSPPRYVRSDTLRDGTSKSCGCLQKEACTTHGAWGKPLFNVWRAMMSRCYKPKDKRFSRYGGRGISVCERWHNVNHFISDMTSGYEQGLQLDRINNDGHYTPDNCRWSTTKQQTRNYSRNVILEHDGKRMCVVDWAIECGIPATVLYDRVARGWSAHKCLTQPVKRSR